MDAMDPPQATTVNERQLGCEAQATVAGILKPPTMEVGAVVRSFGEDKRRWLEAAQAEMDSLLAASHRYIAEG